jgi:hypothetical protein
MGAPRRQVITFNSRQTSFDYDINLAKRVKCFIPVLFAQYYNQTDVYGTLNSKGCRETQATVGCGLRLGGLFSRRVRAGLVPDRP